MYKHIYSLMIFNSIQLENKTDKTYYSVSKLKYFKECGEAFRLKYIEKIKVVSFSEATLMGNFVHSALEYLYTTTDETVNYLIDALERTTEQSLVQLRIVDASEATYLNELLWDYAEDIIVLHNRAALNYEGEDAIRKADGKVSSSPQMTSAWKKAEKEMRLDERRQTIDNFVVNKNIDFVEISLCNVFADAYNICKNYRTPKQVREIIGCEMQISHWDEATKTLINPVPMPLQYGGEEGIQLTGYIDFVCRVEIDRKEVLAIIDHKTSKTAYTEDNVLYNKQMMTYVYAYEYLTGEKIEAIGINNLRENTLSLALLDRDIMEASLKSLFSVHKSIQAEDYVKEVPEDSYSRCLNSFGRECNFLSICYPVLAEKLKAEKKSFKF